MFVKERLAEASMNAWRRSARRGGVDGARFCGHAISLSIPVSLGLYVIAKRRQTDRVVLAKASTSRFR
jgi:hypothetical protein